MKITFLKKHQSSLSGNSLYHPGDEADFVNVKTLLEMGIVREGWESTLAQPGSNPVNTYKGLPDEKSSFGNNVSESRDEPIQSVENTDRSVTLSSMSVVDLQAVAREYKLSYSGLRKSALMELILEYEGTL